MSRAHRPPIDLPPGQHRCADGLAVMGACNATANFTFDPWQPCYLL